MEVFCSWFRYPDIKFPKTLPGICRDDSGVEMFSQINSQ